MRGERRQRLITLKKESLKVENLEFAGFTFYIHRSVLSLQFTAAQSAVQSSAQCSVQGVLLRVLLSSDASSIRFYSVLFSSIRNE